jgi:hypothetical protein
VILTHVRVFLERAGDVSLSSIEQGDHQKSPEIFAGRVMHSREQSLGNIFGTRCVKRYRFRIVTYSSVLGKNACDGRSV